MPKHTSFCFSKEEEILDFHRFGIPSYFSFPKQTIRYSVDSNSLNMYCRNFNIDLTKKFLLFECFY